MMEYRGYVARVEFDSDANVLHGQVVNIRDVITFEATSVDGLRAEFIASVDDYLEFCKSRGESPERPYSGKFVVRLQPELHRDIVHCAAAESLSLNAWIVARLSESVGKKQPQAKPSEAASTFSVVYSSGANKFNEPASIGWLSDIDFGSWQLPASTRHRE